MPNKQRFIIVNLVAMIVGFLLASQGWTAFYRIASSYYEFNAETIRTIFLISSGSYTVIAFVFSVIAAFYLSRTYPPLTWVPAAVCFCAQVLVFEIKGMPASWMAAGIATFNLPALIGGFLPMMVKGIKSICASPNRSISPPSQ